MKQLYMIVLMSLACGVSQHAFAEIVNLTNSATGTNRDSGTAAVKEKLMAACKERGGKADPASFEVVFERTNPGPNIPWPYYVDARMKCNLP